MRAGFPGGISGEPWEMRLWEFFGGTSKASFYVRGRTWKYFYTSNG